MKKFSIFLIVAVAFVASVFVSDGFAQAQTVAAFTTKAYYKASTVEDTSSTINIGAYPHVWFHTTTTGADSTVMYQNFDAYINGLWVNNILRDTLTLGRPTGYVLAATKGQVDYRALRMPSSDLLGGAAYIRIRNKHAAGAGDSTSATTYTQKIHMRKP